MQFIRVAVFAGFLGAVLLGGGHIQAQVKKDNRNSAQFLFDISIDKLLQSSVVNAEALGRLIQFDGEKSPFGAEFQISDINRILGAIDLPDGVGELAKVFYEKEIPFDFIVQIRFSKTMYVQQLNQYLADQEYPVETIDGVKLIRVPILDTKASVGLRQINDSWIAIGTRSFLLNSIRNAASSDASEAWKKCEKGPIRFVVDLKNSRSFFDEVVQLIDLGQAGEQLRKVSQQTDSISISLLPKTDSLLQVGLTTDTDVTPKLQKRLDFLSFELRTAVNRILKPLCEKVDAQPIAIDGIAINVNQSDVSVVVAKPSEFEGMLQRAFEAAREDPETTAAEKTETTIQLP